jgi:hypothetical protein
MYQYYRFFNKKGEYCNFEYDSTKDKWTGRLEFQTVSEGLIEDQQIYILEEVFNTNTNSKVYVYPHSNYSYSGATSNDLIASFDTSINPVPEIFLYQIEESSGDAGLVKSYSVSYDLDYDLGPTYMSSNFDYPNIKSTDVINEKPLQINVAFGPTGEDLYTSVLTLKDSSNHVIAEITLYGEGLEEDERLKYLLMSLGHDILPEDYIIFDTADIKEEKPDWDLINRKRKELLLEYHNIFPYLGSYKAIINILKFYGYQNVHMREYWKNVDITSKNYGKYRQTDIIDLFTNSPDPQISKLIPSKVYRKTSLFGLFYDINVETGEFDDDGTPITEEVFKFSPEEVLIKIFALKKKLMGYYLPFSAKIVDIIGEAIYFANYNINIVTSQNRIDQVSLGIKPKYEVFPERSGYLQDLRPLQYLGAPIGPDLNLGGNSNYYIYRIYVSQGVSASPPITANIDIGLTIGSTNSGKVNFYDDKRRGRFTYTRDEVMESIVEEFNNPTYIPSYNTKEGIEWIKRNYFAYIEPDNPGFIRIVQKNILPGYTASLNLGSANGGISIFPGATVSPAINISPGYYYGATGAPMSLYKTAYLGYFENTKVPITNLNDVPNAPVGYPVILRNKTFDINWDNADVTFNQVDKVGATYSTLLSKFTSSFLGYTGPLGWTSFAKPWASGPTSGSTAGATYISVGVTSSVSEFPYNGWPYKNNFSWEELGYYGYYQMQWKVYKFEDEYPSWSYDSGIRSISDINEISLSLPYIGKYSVELRLWDLYNNQSFIIDEDWIEVKIRDVDFIAWYSKREEDYLIETPRYKTQQDEIMDPLPLGSPPDLLTWDDYSSSWDLPVHPNEPIDMGEISFNSLDSIEFYQTMDFPIDNPLVDRYPYTFNLLGELPTWKDTYHLWWDNTGTKVTEWKITNCSPVGPTYGYIFATRSNSTLNLGATMNYIIGPAGWTGPTSSSISGSTGDITYVESGKRTYVHNGLYWKYVLDELDAIRISVSGNSSNKKADSLSVIKALNLIDPEEHPILSDFIYYYEEKYNSSYGLDSYVTAVSKKFDKGGRHKFAYKNLVGSTSSFETVNFGLLGDIPTYFEIYKLPSSSGVSPSAFTINYLDKEVRGYTTYTHNTSTITLSALCNELNGPSAQSAPVIGDFIYNMVYGASGWTGSGASSITEVKIQGVSKFFTEPQSISIGYTGGMEGNSYGRSLIRNLSWDNVRIHKYTQELPLLTTVNFTFDNCKIPGKTKFEWILEREDDPTFENIYYNNPYFSYMFNQRGSYSVTLTITDTNGNKNKIKKTEIIKIV